ncbi:ferrochelatase hem15 [Saxophila tyrrhenica]|uniref:Ferrochelatase hem15 n=1 Tax=Saxophila tyrrhenica TaxID=1690608 RepID=A0AAV9PJW8_9PEZI|nr:ferrochelatase hem15 [Saxophila tyrrhenica]
MSMLKSLRRNSKQFFEPRRKSVVSLSPAAEAALAANIITEESGSTKESKLSFFDLPAELRNAIYELVAEDTRIFIPSASSKKNGKAPYHPPPPLLLVSGQTRREFLPLLLELAPIRTVIKDLDFSNLTRLISSLYATELRALRCNPNLTLLLQIEKPSRETIASLRRWLTNRAEGLDRIAFHYGIVWTRRTQIIPTSTQVHRINVYIQRRTILSTHLEAMAQLHHNVAETLQFELQPMIECFEEEMSRVTNADPGAGMSMLHENSALMLYGMPTRRVH